MVRSTTLRAMAAKSRSLLERHGKIDDMKWRHTAWIFAVCLLSSAAPVIADDATGSQRGTREAVYLGYYSHVYGSGALVEISPFARFYVCLEADGRVFVGRTSVTTPWAYHFNLTKLGSRIGIVDEGNHVLTTWPDGKTAKLTITDKYARIFLDKRCKASQSLPTVSQPTPN